MKIGFDGRYAEGDLVGVGKYIKSLILELDKLGVECIIFYSKRPKYKISSKNIRTVILSSPNRIYFEQFSLPKAFKKYKIDLYHAPGNMGVPLFSNVKSILTIHDLIPLQYQNYFNYSKLPFLSKILYTFRLNTSIRRAEKIVSVSKFTKGELVAMDVEPKKISVIYSGLNNLPKTSMTNFYGDYIINNGGLDIRKNTDGLIKAFALVHKKFPNLRLVLTGKNTRFENELIRLISNLELKDSVVFTGYVNDNRLASLVKNAKCLCYPSIIEGFGFPVLEAFSLGTPVVTSNSSSIPEIATNSALMVDPKSIAQISNAIIKLLTDENLRESLIKSGLKRVEMFSWEKSAKEYIVLYKQVLNENN